MAILLLIILLGSIALPLTSGFIGEFLMITGLFSQSIWYAFIGGLTMIFGAVYMFYAYQRVMLGEENTSVNNFTDLKKHDYVFLVPLAALIIILGVYPQPIFNIVEHFVTSMQNILVPFAGLASKIIP
jgi:NADH-quinone oxidoreductase subunit M